MDWIEGWSENQQADWQQHGLPALGDELTEKQQLLSATTALTALTQWAVVAVTGEDALTFLQGQLSCDVAEVSSTQSRLATWCTHKGRIMMVCRVFKQADGYVLTIPHFQVDGVLQRLRMYVLRAKVSFSLSDQQLLGLFDPTASVVNTQVAALGSDQCAQIDEICYLRLPSDTAMYYLLADEQVLKNYWQQYSGLKVGFAAWQLQEILAGQAYLSPQTVESFIPQMLNFQVLNAVSFSKGCYTGQEIIARTKYLGKIKRRLYLCHADTQACPQAGDALATELDTRGQSVGFVVATQSHPDNGCLLLVVAQSKIIEAKQARLDNPQGAVLTIKTLPYEQQLLAELAA